MKKYVLILLGFVCLYSCDPYDEDVLPLVGIYDGNVQGYAGYFTISVSIDRGDHILIDAPWDSEWFYVLEAEVCNEADFEKEIHIPFQSIGPGIEIEGSGVYFDRTLQIDYELIIEGWSDHYTMIGSK